MREIMRTAPAIRRARVASRVITLALMALVVPSLLSAHAVVFPKRSAPGAYEKYVLRVPNEKAVATVRVELRFPADVRVTSFADVAGWQLETLTDSAKRVIGAVWSGTLAPQRFVEFPFVAVNPKAGARLVWPAYQTYADGERVEWTGAEGEKAPASVTMVAAVTDSAGGAPGATSKEVRWLPWAALVLALVSLGLTIRLRNP